jgi:hypothetical protein
MIDDETRSGYEYGGGDGHDLWAWMSDDEIRNDSKNGREKCVRK